MLANGGGRRATPDNQLEIFAVTPSGLTHLESVPVGLEPVAVAARDAGEVWVVNHLSDSISIVDVAASPARVTRTLLVGDEPRDIVFAGSGGQRAFISTAHRGQNRPADPQLTTPGVGRADLWIFDASNLGADLGGTPLTIVELFTDTPRALAVSPDGGTVLAAGFHSGNRTTTINEGLVCNGGAAAPPCTVSGAAMPGGQPAPNTNFAGVAQPEVGMIVRWDGANWLDPLGRSWNNAVRFALPDRDFYAIDALANPPVEYANAGSVGTIIFNMAINPVTLTVYASNIEARNDIRFEGSGAFGGSTVPRVLGRGRRHHRCRACFDVAAAEDQAAHRGRGGRNHTYQRCVRPRAPPRLSCQHALGPRLGSLFRVDHRGASHPRVGRRLLAARTDRGRRVAARPRPLLLEVHDARSLAAHPGHARLGGCAGRPSARSTGAPPPTYGGWRMRGGGQA